MNADDRAADSGSAPSAGGVIDPRDALIRALYLEIERLRALKLPKPRLRLIECSGGRKVARR